MSVRTVIFARVSTREQAEEGYSLPAQEKLLTRYAEEKGLNIVKRFSVPESARGSQERVIFNELLEYISQHSEIKVLICEKVDRITRNFKDAVKLDDWLNEDPDRQIHFVKQSLVIHKESKSHERFQWDIYIALARQYSNNLSEETRKGLYEKAAEGWYPGNHKRGYVARGETGHKDWLIDTSNKDHIFLVRAFELFSTGTHTLRTVCKALFNEGWSSNSGKQISIGEMHKLLIDPFYCGEFFWNGKKYEGKHNPIITKELFYRVQEVLKRDVRAGKYRKHSFVFGGGLLVCGECGRAITAEMQKGHAYYHCTKFNGSCSQQGYIREEEIDRQVGQALDSLVIENPKIQEWIRKALKESHQDEHHYHTDVVSELEERSKAIENRLSYIYDDMVDQKISKEFYLKKKAEYDQQLDELQEARGRHIKANFSYMQLGFNIFELSQKGRYIYENKFLAEEKREYLNFVFSNFKLKDKKLVPVFQNGYEVVAKRAEDKNWLPG